MNSMMTMDRPAMPMTMPGLPMPGAPSMMPGAGMMGMPGMNPMMVPQCTIKMERMDGGMCIACKCDDKMAADMMQSMAMMMPGAMCSCMMMMNGMPMMSCCMMMGATKCEMMDGGVKITCTSGDADCCKMIQACCDCMMAMMKAGCMCCVMMGGMPMCCGC